MQPSIDSQSMWNGVSLIYTNFCLPSDGGGGGSRGGASNLFTAGGFFGPGGRANLLKRLRMVLIFFVWSSCVYTLVSSVFKLLRQTASGISGSLRGQSSEPSVSKLMPDEVHETLLSTEGAEDEVEISAGAKTSSVCRNPESASFVVSSGKEKDLPEASMTSIGRGGPADLEGIEALSVDGRQRAYLDLLKRHSSSSRMAGERSQGEQAAHSLGIYVMILGCVAFFFVAA